MMGTHEAILTLRLNLEDRLKKNTFSVLTFVGHKKAFDNINILEKSFEILKGNKIRKRKYHLIIK